ncbi:hypothetical protein CGMCC3_g15844 [Colletotrichum fructicola]|uniref:Uncharacterized protein n=1 Tax=Colletotrichum fructicola (strain Nara gc5) TaxID=1213859 RepID=L2FFT9_COLFN|nr:uncharacterized protein CGMCC3_g15844 [Colletotrichum fructicola]KAE9568045.1 hypothetical protein CGMCC3_g15844 [Colletotrichum fructicola]KAF4882660.1 hypothetical protein CGCFRS4_v014350 [Colletotrichum fructicola]
MASSDSPSDFDWDTWPDLESVDGSSPAPAASSRAATQQPTPDGRLPLLRLMDWDASRTYDEQPPTCIHYHLEWKLTVNNRSVSKDSEPDLVLAPGDYWDLTLRSKLNYVAAKKLAPNKSFKPDDTTVIVSVRDRSEEDLVKRFDDLDIEWDVVETQLRTWSGLFRAGKRLKISVSFNYVETGPAAGSGGRRGTKRSATQRMLAERDAEIEDDRDRTGQVPVWEQVYSLMRCPGPPCDLGPHCWVDDHGKKHYKLATRHLASLITHVKDGGELKSHTDMPRNIRDLLYAEDQQRLDRQARSGSQAKYPPINITNVMPGSDASAGVPLPGRESGSAPAPSHTPTRLKIPGPRDSAMKTYCEWQCSQVLDESFKAGYRKAYEVMVEHCLDLEQVDEDQDAQFFMDNGVKKGAATRFIRDIREWASGWEQEQP